MKRSTAVLAGVLAVVSLAACVSEPQRAPREFAEPAIPADPAAIMDDSVPPVARQACLDEVRRTTNNPQVTILGMIYSEANSDVTVGVGPDRARWRCLVSRDGVVADVTSLTDEGAL